MVIIGSLSGTRHRPIQRTVLLSAPMMYGLATMHTLHAGTDRRQSDDTYRSQGKARPE